MKPRLPIILGIAVLCAIPLIGFAIYKSLKDGPQTPELTTGPDPRITGYKNWHIVNEERVLMEPEVAAMCARPKQYGALNPHVSKYITVYVNEIGKAAMLSKEPVTFPPGSIIVKEKYDDIIGGQPAGLTFMVKREKGFNTAVGDWEFVTADREDRVYKNVDLSHCASCHQATPNSDYVFRTYLPKDD